MNQANSHNSRHLRWTKTERFQHWVLAITFIVLVFTGFTLKYPDAWWISPFIGSDIVFNLRSTLHRIAGAIFIAAGFYHVGYLSLTRRGRWQILALRPQMQDLRDALQNFAFNLGLAKQRPRFGHYGYIEKAEYWALIWGAVVMGSTGLLLWLDNWTLSVFPRWVMDLLTVIHLYEAWLATLAIVVWHFYSVIFNPDVYPIDLSMINGKISDEMLRDEHFLEYMELQEQESKAPHTDEIQTYK